MMLDFTAILAQWQLLWSGALLTAKLALVTTLTGFLIGTLCAAARRSESVWLARLTGVYVESIRNTPFLVQIFLVYFGLSSLGFSFSAFTVSVIALTINVGAYTAEIMRAGFESIHKGQWEAAETLGLNRWQQYWHVALRPAIERVYPSLTSQFILLMLASSVTSQISAEELTATANFIQSETYRPFETFFIVACIYIALSLLMRVIFWLFGQVIFPRRRRLGTSI
ncbi:MULTISPECIES: amino acid ABC transporter permease [Raoultella]|jgi:polar amino acid transport system permease protein|uniref:Amino acid ABC transporter membrane protein 1 (PAAT family) n=2 Tax=Raoultella TaxID=160674 RepID=A0ABD7QH05_RAOOR|nr:MULTISPECIES: amino acid ABC transporter permease [Raoultella]TCQ72507.1 amino acid ABC transporter membrane protein 1 (PAAT family) [Raoultella ornithinolytica]MCI1031404.1 amino acid ABC transporter permease [Raoultella terrigena]MCS4273143.1 polar amino acid transport system permease protein [Raoultella sp. BIGb0132]MCS4289485.1 polar amino acid transport system permease protein [Raoultella terrigena]ROR99511.1 amino acid ABC transporter membrane protein 1 (PAAT family) [Raoultella terri